MSKVLVDFHIKNESQTQSFQTKGTLNDNRLVFKDENDQKHVIKLRHGRLDYERQGDPAFQFIFEKHVLHEGLYKVGKQSMPLDIQTHHLDIAQDNIVIDYTLKQDDVVVGHSTVKIHYRRLKEGSA